MSAQEKIIKEAPLSSFRRFLIVLGIVFILGISFWLIWIDQHRTVPILMYHHVDDMGKHDVSTVTPEQFEGSLQYLAKNHFEVLTLDDVVEANKNNKRLSRKSVVITFDDGAENNFTNAFPLLKKYGYKAIMFVISDRVGLPGYMTWDQIAEMQEYGIVIGSHTRRHKYLPELNHDELTDEIFNSRKIFQEHLKTPVNHFSYPIGGFNNSIKEMVRNAGYLSAVATNRGYERYNNDLFELKRVTVDEKDNFGAIRWAKFSGYYNLFRKPKKPE
ncbi:MAG: polysaccharide deacetylase family protein [Candidatus Omnitrophica bacterium]|nr:polysaccharide deacetylase family protein [Candidatus Omnitrophota bacterium]